MIQYIAIYTADSGHVIRVVGPFNSESAAQEWLSALKFPDSQYDYQIETIDSPDSMPEWK